MAHEPTVRASVPTRDIDGTRAIDENSIVWSSRLVVAQDESITVIHGAENLPVFVGKQRREIHPAVSVRPDGVRGAIVLSIERPHGLGLTIAARRDSEQHACIGRIADRVQVCAPDSRAREPPTLGQLTRAPGQSVVGGPQDRALVSNRKHAASIIGDDRVEEVSLRCRRRPVPRSNGRRCDQSGATPGLEGTGVCSYVDRRRLRASAAREKED